jgi:hypothetical protein
MGPWRIASTRPVLDVLYLTDETGGRRVATGDTGELTPSTPPEIETRRRTTGESGSMGLVVRLTRSHPPNRALCSR